jgi:hypothetical protein
MPRAPYSVVLIVLACACRRAPSQPRDASASAVVPAPSATLDGSPEAGAAATEDPPDAVHTLTLRGAPALTLRTIGPALIEVRMADGAAPAKVLVERRQDADAAAVFQKDTIEKPSYPVPDWRRHRHAAAPGTSYRYRARANGPWSEEVVLRTPDVTAPPPPPSDVAVRAEGPFATRLTWKATSRRAYGFEVQVKVGQEFVRAALLDPTEQEFVHHLRLPGQSLAYRIVAWNVRGASAPTAPVTITTPAGLDPSIAKAAPMAPCAPVPKHAKGCGFSELTKLESGSVVIYSVPLSKRCGRRLMGRYDGCTRELGSFDLQDDVVEVEGFANEGWPLLHAVAGAGEYVGAQIVTLQFAGGRYSLVDMAVTCGERHPDANDLVTGVAVPDELTQCTPPFETCQEGPISL